MLFVIVLIAFTIGSFIHDVRGEQNTAMVIELEGTINPGTAQFVTRGLKKAGSGKYMLVIIRLDTPGGLDPSMRSIVKGILNASLPVVVYVAPRGARAASAGVMITIAAHVAAMAPQTNIGAAHPVSAGGKEIDKTMSEKVVNDMVAYARSIAEERGRNADWVEKAIRESVSITGEVAVKNSVVDLVARDVDDLLGLLDGKEILLDNSKVKLETKGLKLMYFSPGWRDRVLGTISNPNIAYILMMIGLAGLYFELAHPGAIFPGVIGAISLILAFFAFQTLPVNYAGLLLIALAIIFFIAEIKVSSYGLLSVAGLISLILGSVMLFENIGVSLRLMMPTIVLIGGFFITIAFLAFRAYRGTAKGGLDGLLGEVGIVEERIDPVGLIFAHGEYWKASCTEVAEQGEKVRIIGSKGLELIVKKEE
ncbi:MAG: nodulation protein NfeD [Deltaproteobacteria bacterium]|nr:MAG: nodulation protein NfeD [Deltaproteobacteria bacterium]